MSEDEFGSIAENYERYFVPLIFADYAVELANAACLNSNAKILETSCGTGALTRALLSAMDSRSRLIATDVSEPMLKVARESVDDRSDVEFRLADATQLPFEDGEFDVVACQFGVMFFPDVKQGYREAARVLKQGGHFVFNMWDSLENNLFAKTVHNAVGAMFPEDPPKFLELPFADVDLLRLVRDLQSVGFKGIEIAVQPKISRADQPRHVALGFATGGPLAGDIAKRVPLSEAIDEITSRISSELGRGPNQGPMQALQVSAFLP